MSKTGKALLHIANNINKPNIFQKSELKLFMRRPQFG